MVKLKTKPAKVDKLKTKQAKVDKKWTKSGQVKNITSKSRQTVDKQWTSYGEYGWQGGAFRSFVPHFGGTVLLGVAGEGALGAPPKWGQFGKYGPAIT